MIKIENKLMVYYWCRELKEKIQNVNIEDDNIAHKATQKKHSHLTLDNSLTTNLNYSKLSFLYQVKTI